MKRHNTIYTVLLAIYALFTFCGTGGILLYIEPFQDKYFAVSFGLFLGVMSLVVLVLRLRKSRFARIATRIANILLLPVFFVGTALGIYGLLMVDRRQKNEVGKEQVDPTTNSPNCTT